MTDQSHDTNYFASKVAQLVQRCSIFYSVKEETNQNHNTAFKGQISAV